MSEAIKISELRSRLNEAMSDDHNLDDETKSKLREIAEKCSEYLAQKINELDNALFKTLQRFYNWLKSLSGTNESQINESVKSFVVKKFSAIGSFLRDALAFIFKALAIISGTIGLVGIGTAMLGTILGIMGLHAFGIAVITVASSAISALTGIQTSNTGILGFALLMALIARLIGGK